MSNKQVRFAILFSVFGFGLLWVIALQPVTYHLQSYTFVDDAYYYLGYAKNISSGHGPTFDGIVMTNGVQPLWALILTIVAFFVRGDLALMHASLVLAIALVMVASFLMYQLLSRFFTGQVLYITTVFYIALACTASLFLTGMESPIILLTFILSLRVVLRIQSFDMRQNLIAGCFLSLTFLARLDLLLMTPTFALLLIWSNGTLRQQKWQEALLSVLTLALPCVVVLGAYIGMNVLAFDIPLPISGMVKSTLYANQLESSGGRYTLSHIVQISQETLQIMGVAINFYLTTLLVSFNVFTLFTRIIFLIGILAIIVSIYRNRRRIIRMASMSRLTINGAVPMLIVINVLFHAWVQLFTTGYDNVSSLTWYHVHIYILLTFVIGFVVKWLSVTMSPHLLKAIQIWVTRSFVVGMGFWVRTLAVTEGIQPYDGMYAGARWVNENVPADDIIGSFNAGVSGYFTDQTVINLDGLMNNKEVLHIRENRQSFVEYAQKYNIRWLMDYQVTAQDTLGETFRGFPSAMLTIRYEVPFLNFGFRNSRFIVAEIDLQSSD